VRAGRGERRDMRRQAAGGARPKWLQQAARADILERAARGRAARAQRQQVALSASRIAELEQRTAILSRVLCGVYAATGTPRPALLPEPLHLVGDGAGGR
jgi:hypothetical protein